jgi:hypothetical protein
MLLGAFLPKTDAGTIVGIPEKIIDPVASFAASPKNFLLPEFDCLFFIASCLEL